MRRAATGDDLTSADQQRPQSPASRIGRRMAWPHTRTTCLYHWNRGPHEITNAHRNHNAIICAQGLRRLTQKPAMASGITILARDDLAALMRFGDYVDAVADAFRLQSVMSKHCGDGRFAQ